MTGAIRKARWTLARFAAGSGLLPAALALRAWGHGSWLARTLRRLAHPPPDPHRRMQPPMTRPEDQMGTIVTLDVRAMLASGQEPFSAIMQAADALGPGQTLRLIAPFRPVPLIGVMRQRGFSFAEHPLGGDVWQVDFSPPPGALSAGSSLEAADWPQPSRLLDLTGLEPPEPMSRLLSALEAARPGEVVFALLDREPVALLPQLKTRGHAWVGNHAADASGYRLLVRRGTDA